VIALSNQSNRQIGYDIIGNKIRRQELFLQCSLLHGTIYVVSKQNKFLQLSVILLCEEVLTL